MFLYSLVLTLLYGLVIVIVIVMGSVLRGLFIILLSSSFVLEVLHGYISTYMIHQHTCPNFKDEKNSVY